MRRWANKLDQYHKLEKDGRHTEKQKCKVRSAINEIINPIRHHWANKIKDARSITSCTDEIYDKNIRRHLDRL
jgi:hypothetical protein